MLLWLALAVTAHHTGAAPPWRRVRDADGIAIWQREVPGSPIYEIRVETVFAASSERIWQVIRDVAQHSSFLPYVAESRVLRNEDAMRRLVYQRISPPVVNDRDYTIRTIAWPDHETGVFEQHFAAANNQGPPPRRDAVRVANLKGGWILEPLDAHHTRIVYWIHTDPGGLIPAWLINLGSRISVPRLLAAIEKRATRGSPQP